MSQGALTQVLNFPEKTMSVLMRSIFSILILLIAVSCSHKPIRHLASDASLIKTGVSTRDDVLTFLGDPDAQQMASPTLERWIYYEELESSLQKTPYLGSWFSSKGYSRLVVTFEGDLVVDCVYSAYDTGEFDWSDDFSWQEKRQ